jgi:hypothetical protein
VQRERVSRGGVLAAAVVLVMAAGCGDGHPVAVASQRQSVVYGDDDREEVLSPGQPAWLVDVARTRLLALGDAQEISFSPSAGVTLRAATLQERFDVCAGEAFSQQPSFATCSAVIVSPHWVLTTAHCTRALPLSDLVGVSRFYNAASGAGPVLDSTDLHTFTEVIAHEDYWDYAWLRLGEPLPGVEVAPMEAIAEGADILSVNHGAGLPAKVTSSKAVNVDAASFLSTLDAFGGASGGPVFSGSGALVGMLTSGAPDYEPSVDGCLKIAHRVDVADAAEEHAVRVELALDALCATVQDPELCQPLVASEGTTGCSFAGARPSSLGNATFLGILSLHLLFLGLRRRPLQKGCGANEGGVRAAGAATTRLCEGMRIVEWLSAGDHPVGRGVPSGAASELPSLQGACRGHASAQRAVQRLTTLGYALPSCNIERCAGRPETRWILARCSSRRPGHTRFYLLRSQRIDVEVLDTSSKHILRRHELIELRKTGQ